MVLHEQAWLGSASLSRRKVPRTRGLVEQLVEDLKELRTMISMETMADQAHSALCQELQPCLTAHQAPWAEPEPGAQPAPNGLFSGWRARSAPCRTPRTSVHFCTDPQIGSRANS